MFANLLRRAASAPHLFAPALLLAAAAAHAATPTTVIISQLYGAGGNSGALLNADFVELFNPTSSPISLAGYSIQYASAAGASISVNIPIANSPTLQPGQYYVIAATPGSTGTGFTADQTSSNIAFGAAAGKVYLVSSTTQLSSATCAVAGNIVDVIPYGTTTSCANPAPAPSTSKSDLRINTCNITGVPSTDYSNTTNAAPRNSSTTFAPCGTTGGSTSIGVSGAANPASINTGSSTLLTATITPGTNPTSTGITVSVNLNAIGGSTTQKLYDDGSNGDVTANDNVFSYSTTVNTAGTFSFPVTATDTQARTGTGAIALTAAAPPPTVAIHDIQGTGVTSPYNGTAVTTSGIVTGIGSNGFFIQAPDNQIDADPNTPEGIFIFSSTTALPSYIVIGNSVQVSGTVASYSSATSPTPETELTKPLFSLLSTGNALPTPIAITASQDSPSGGIYQFLKYEGMRVAIASLTTTQGTDATLTESTETSVSNGQCWGIVTGVARPFRESGISLTDAAYTTAIPSTIPRFDANPELLFIDSVAFGGPAINVTANTTLTNVSGVVDFSTGVAGILIDAANRPVVSGGLTINPLPTPSAGEFTIASFNMERFYTSDSTAAKNPGSSVSSSSPPPPTSAASRRSPLPSATSSTPPTSSELRRSRTCKCSPT